VQSSNTAQHLFTTPQVIAHISKKITLNPGDLIYMGTPGGTRVEGAKGKGLKNVDWMKVGGVLKSEVGGLGVAENTILSNADWKAHKLGKARL
jgi:2-keto-4-pentenoate hydratase/2-oxohepta-3-ene-1,7-dioic acid hydratase in catechol pathway